MNTYSSPELSHAHNHKTNTLKRNTYKQKRNVCKPKSHGKYPREKLAVNSHGKNPQLIAEIKKISNVCIPL